MRLIIKGLTAAYHRLPITYYLLRPILTTCYLLLTVNYVLTTSEELQLTYYTLLATTCYLLLTTFYVILIIDYYYLLPATCDV